MKELTSIENNALVISEEIQWLKKLIYERIRFDNARPALNSSYSVYEIPPPEFFTQTPYSDFVKQNNISFEERVLLILSLTPHIDSTFLTREADQDSELRPEYKVLMGVRGTGFKGVLPTGLTFIHIIAGNNIKQILTMQALLSNNSGLVKQGVISLEPHYKGDPCFSGKLVMEEEFVELFTVGKTDKQNSLKYAFNNQKKITA